MDVISTLISILAMLGLSELQTTIKEKYASNEGVSEDDILKVINAINNNTRNISDKTLAQISNKLNSITFPAGMSDSIKQHIYSVRNKLNKEQQSLSSKLNEVERNINSIDERARVYMSLDPNTRIANKNTLMNLIKDAAKQNEIVGGEINNNKNVNDMTNRIEESINNNKETLFDKTIKSMMPETGITNK